MINKSLVFVEGESSDKNQIISFLAGKAWEAGSLSDVQEYIHSVNEREEVASTFIGLGVSIPHGKSDAVKTPFIAFMRLKKGVMWDEDSEENTKLVFLIGVPNEKKGDLHLRILAEISRIIMEEDFREKLLVSNQDEVYGMLRKIEEGVGKE